MRERYLCIFELSNLSFKFGFKIHGSQFKEEYIKSYHFLVSKWEKYANYSDKATFFLTIIS